MWIEAKSAIWPLVPLAIVATAVGLLGHGRLHSSALLAQEPGPADLVLLNGKIITVDANDSIAQAVAIKDGVFARVGTNASVRAFVGPGTQVLHLNGRTVTPGLIDSHTHLLLFGLAENEWVNLRPPVGSIAEIVVLIAERVAQVQPGEWVIGDGFFQLVEGRNPTRGDIDPVSPNNPVFLNSIGGHFATANSKALEVAGIDKNTPNPVGGIIEKDSDGELTGRLWNHPAMDMVRRNFPPLGLDAQVADILFAQERFVVEGVTSFQDVNTRGLTRLQAYEAAEDHLKLRGYLLFTVEREQDADISLQQTLFARPMLTYAGDKFLLDGQLPTSYTYEPHPGPSYDIPTWDPAKLKEVVKQLHGAGHQLAFHVVGDKAIDLALDAIEEALNDTPRANHRHRLEHAVIPTSAAIDRIKRLGVVVSAQPHMIFSGGDSWVSIWGPGRTQRAVPLRTFLSTGISLALGSDFPTVPELSPQLALWAAVARKTSSGAAIAPLERITIQQALRAHTMGSAYAAFEEDIKGSIEEGKFADLDVWSGDLYTVPTDQIRELRTTIAIVGGKIVFLAGDITGDGVIRADDLLKLIRFLVQLDEPSEAQRIAADVNADGAMDVADLSSMVGALFGTV